jgi:hypothetical protein
MEVSHMKRLLLLPIACSLVLSAYSMKQDPSVQNEWSKLQPTQRYNQFVEAGGNIDRSTWDSMNATTQYDIMVQLQKQHMQSIQPNKRRQTTTRMPGHTQPASPSATNRFFSFLRSCITTPVKFVWNNKERLALVAIAAAALYNNYNGLGTWLKQYTPDKVQAFVDFCLNKAGLDMTTSAEELLTTLQGEFDNSSFLYRWTHSRPMTV